jgi:histidyl-tRNA synthetase
LWQELGLVEGQDIRLELNSLGQPDERLAHRQALIAHFESNADVLDEDARRRLHTNPLRILDSKNPQMQPLIDAAPKLLDFLGEASRAHFQSLRAVLDAAGLPYRINPRLVRGMDYYNLTVFEWVTEKLGAQGTVCGGGRYDGLIAQLGGKPAPAVGWGMGVERLLILLEAVGIVSPESPPDVYAVVTQQKELPQVLPVLEALRAHGVKVVLNAAGADGAVVSMKAQFRRADASGARDALIFGEAELARGEVALKALRDPGAPQTALRMSAVEEWAARWLPANATA